MENRLIIRESTPADIATQFMQTAQRYLKSIGCTRAVLHASATGKLVYERLDYVDSNEMVLNLT
ncbi:MAG: hypothetical protein AAF572_17425 [Cyanobacteria bacterium P01_B01_bin.77]